MAGAWLPVKKRRGWPKDGDGWWSQGDDPAFMLRFGEETEAKLVKNDSSQLQLQDVIQDVEKVALLNGSVDQIRRLFDAINSSKPSGLRNFWSLETGLSDGGVEILAESIQLGCLSSLHFLFLARQDIFALAKANASGGLPELRYLHLVNTKLMDDHWEAYETALTKIPSVTVIHLSSANIGNKGAEGLGRAIKSGHLKDLRLLHLDNNSIGDDGINILATAFMEGETNILPELQELELNNNPFREVGIMSLAQALKSGCLLSQMSLSIENSRNPSEKGAGAIVSALSHNQTLIVLVEFEWHLFRRYKQVEERNAKAKNILKKLVKDPWVPASFSKIYLCGNPEVGKTTLRRTFERSWSKSLLTWETWPRAENRTRGVDVSQILSKDNKLDETPMRLMVWDMAGQEDYHLIHNAFFPTQSNATTFIIVCTTTDLEQAVKELDYWLRYIASSCDKIMEDMHVQAQSTQENASHNRRHVFAVLNKFKTDDKVMRVAQDWEKMAQAWINVLDNRRKKFIKYLDIQTEDVFLVDVRKHKAIQGLKRRIMEHCRNCLKHMKVPAICQVIQEKLPDWSERKKHFPVLEWREFLQEVRGVSGFKENDTIEAATKYLNEAGVLIYIDKALSHESLNSPRKLVVLDPNWFCREIIGHIFLTPDMVRLTMLLFRMEVGPTMGSISESHFKTCFKSTGGKWNDQEFNDLIAVLRWLGVCYKGNDDDLFFPALSAENGTPDGRWGPHCQHLYGEEQWVMGFLVEHQKTELALAPMLLWHRFQVKLAQIPQFNGDVQNNFVAGKYFMTFTVDFMDVLMEVDANKDIPTFDQIRILVKPMMRTDPAHLDGNQRKQCQVDLASDLVEILLEHWNQVCPGVEYLERVVWPWPASQDKLKLRPERNVKVSQVKKWVEEHGLGKVMHWEVGFNSIITEDQLLSKKDKKHVIDSVEGRLHILREGMREAVELQIFPSDVFPEEISNEDPTVALDGNEMCIQPMKPHTQTILRKLNSIDKKVAKVDRKLDDIQEGLKGILKIQKDMLHKIQDTDKIFLQDKESTCPKYIYLGEKKSGAFRTLKDAYSETVQLHFACEAEYSDCGPHKVKDQEGLELSELKDWAKTIVPWLRVSLTVLFISAKVAANAVLPGIGMVLPQLVEAQRGQALSAGLSEGIAWLMGFTKDELDDQLSQEMKLDAKASEWDPRVLYGRSREAMTRYIGKLTPDAYQKKLGLRKVCLLHNDDSLRGVFWICSDCFEKYRESNTFNITEL